MGKIENKLSKINNDANNGNTEELANNYITEVMGNAKESKRNKVFLVLVGILFLIICIEGFILLKHYIDNKPVEFNTTDEMKETYKGTEISLDIVGENKEFKLSLDRLSIKISDTKTLNLNKDLVDKIQSLKVKTDSNEATVGEYELYSLDIYNNFLYLTYTDKEHSKIKEIMLSEAKPASLDLSDTIEVNKRMSEKLSKDNKNFKIHSQSYDNSFLLYSETMQNNNIKEETLVNYIETIESGIKYSELKTEEVTVNVGNLGVLKLSQIDDLKDAPGIYYNNENKVVSLYNYERDISYGFITYINNPAFLLDLSEMLKTNYDNLFVSSTMDDINGDGYRTFIVCNEHEAFAFRVSSEASEQTLVDILKQLGIDRNNISINIEQYEAVIE